MCASVLKFPIRKVSANETLRNSAAAAPHVAKNLESERDRCCRKTRADLKSNGIFLSIKYLFIQSRRRLRNALPGKGAPLPDGITSCSVLIYMCIYLFSRVNTRAAIIADSAETDALPTSCAMHFFPTNKDVLSRRNAKYNS